MMPIAIITAMAPDTAGENVWMGCIAKLFDSVL
jgi:hypothetical protein